MSRNGISFIRVSEGYRKAQHLGWETVQVLIAYIYINAKTGYNLGSHLASVHKEEIKWSLKLV